MRERPCTCLAATVCHTGCMTSHCLSGNLAGIRPVQELGERSGGQLNMGLICLSGHKEGRMADQARFRSLNVKD